MKFIIVLLLLIFGVGSYFLFFQKEETAPANFWIGEAELTVEIADDIAEQYQGLSGRASLCENCGMVFVYATPKIQNFVMRGMKLPLDFVFIREGKIVEIVENVPPPRGGENPILITSSVTADRVLEINAGFIQRYRIKVGDSAGFGSN